MRYSFFMALLGIGLMVMEAEAQSGTQGKKNAIELANYAQEILPPELAKAVHEEIKKEVDRRIQADGSKSFATLFLADQFYNELETGRFEGTPTVMWNGINDGRPTFYYKGDDFAYVMASGRKIQPKDMDTDGGSVPKILHSVGSFDPWTYGPAFLIHDWIFVAHKCGTAPDSNIAFETSANVMAETMKTLMEAGFINFDGEVQRLAKREDTLYVIYLAVKSPIARNRWDTMNNVTCR